MLSFLFKMHSTFDVTWIDPTIFSNFFPYRNKNKTEIKNENPESKEITVSFGHIFSVPPVGFMASKVPENLDAIIIGSGVGGLGLAVLLAKVGKRVLVLEQHNRAGGCCHTFTEKGFEFDVG